MRIMRCRRRITVQQHQRAGLAPLELTLTMPLMIFVLCLMINFGVIGSWKVRTQVAARYAGWGTVAERTGQMNPPPENWPSNAIWEEIGGDPLATVDQQWNAHPDLMAPCIRGPMLTSPHQTIPVTVERRLEMETEVQRGHARLDKAVPLLRGATTNGRFVFDLNQDLFDNRWQFFTMGFSSNEQIRALAWYAIEHDELSRLDPTIQQEWDRVQELSAQLRSNPRKCRLYPLDRDEEFQRYTGNSPDFYPRVSGCTVDVNHVAMNIVQPLIGRIDRLPCTIGSRFTGMYRSWICQLEACQYPDGEIQPLRVKYNDLAQFMGGLPRNLGCGDPGQLQRCQCPPMQNCPCPPSPIPDSCF
jgi:hypothetical protein